jgi:cytochrome c5
MKKIIVLVFIGIALYSCSKKITSTASAPKVEKPAVSVAVPTAAPQPGPIRKKIESEKPAPPSPAADGSRVEVVNNKETPQIVEGKVTYKTKCGKCHDLKDPQAYDAAKWVKIVDWMAPKAKLDATEKVNVLAFVSLYAKK